MAAFVPLGNLHVILGCAAAGCFLGGRLKHIWNLSDSDSRLPDAHQKGSSKLPQGANCESRVRRISTIAIGAKL
jgi:hypothetical protein